MCKRGRKGLHVPPGIWRYIGIVSAIVAVALVVLVITNVPDRTSAATGGPITEPVITPTPGGFPTGLTEDEVAAIQEWNQWFFEREQAYKDAMYEQWKIQMGDDAVWLFGSFEENIGSPLSSELSALKQEVETLRLTADANRDAATQLQGLVVTPTPEIVTVIEYVVEYVEVPVEVQVPVPPTQYDYCLWFETEMNRQAESLSGNIAPGTFFLIMHESGCNEVLG